jgi:hypothetical protein
MESELSIALSSMPIVAATAGGRVLEHDCRIRNR